MLISSRVVLIKFQYSIPLLHTLKKPLTVHLCSCTVNHVIVVTLAGVHTCTVVYYILKVSFGELKATYVDASILAKLDQP